MCHPHELAQAAPGAKLRDWDPPGQTWGPLKGFEGLEEKQHALGDALGGLWGRTSKVLIFHFVLCLTLWLCVLQVPAQIYLRGGRTCWCKLCRQLCLSCKSCNRPFSSPQLLSCQSQPLQRVVWQITMTLQSCARWTMAAVPPCAWA